MRKRRLYFSGTSVLCGLLLINTCYASVTLPNDVRNMADVLHYSAQEQQKRRLAIEETKANIKNLQEEIEKLENIDVKREQYKESLRQQLREYRQQLANVSFEYNRKENRLLELQNKKIEIESRNSELNQAVETYGEGRKGYFAYQEIIYNEGIYDDLVGEEYKINDEILVLDESIMFLNQAIDDLVLKMSNENIAEDSVVDEDDRTEQMDSIRVDLLAAQSILKEYYTGYDLDKRNNISFSTESKYYSWQDDKGNKGSQFYQPFYYSVVKGSWEYSFSSGLISSDNRSNDNGKVNCVTDTNLGLAYTKKAHRNDLMIFSVEINLPTGQDTLHEFAPVMDEDLVEKSRFGEGLNFTPAFWYNYSYDSKNTVVFGTYYTFSGKYDLTHVTWVEPGNAWVKEIRWQHLNKKIQFLAGMSHTAYEKTKENYLAYTSGNQFKPEITFNYAPDDTQFFTAYYWHKQENPLKYSTFDNINETRHGKNYGVQWSKDIHENKRIRLLVDWFNGSGENYDPLTDISTNQRRKVTLGIGFDRYFKDKSEKLSIDVETFRMKDGTVSGDYSDNKYHGLNVYLRFLKYM